MTIGVCPGSFDPVTNGHRDIIARAAGLFDTLIVVAVTNPNKPGRFDLTERLALLEEACADITADAQAHGRHLEFDSAEGLLADFCRDVGAAALVKGLRSGADFEYERSFAAMNAHLAGVDTLFLAASPAYSYLSSSLVFEVSHLGGDVSEFVPPNVLAALRERHGGADPEDEGRREDAG